MTRPELAVSDEHATNLAEERELAEQILAECEEQELPAPFRAVMYDGELIGIIGATEFWDDFDQDKHDTYAFRSFVGEGRTVVLHRPTKDRWGYMPLGRTVDGFEHDISVATGPLEIAWTKAASDEEAVNLVLEDIESDDDPNTRIDSHSLRTDEGDYDKNMAELDKAIADTQDAAAAHMEFQRDQRAQHVARVARHAGHTAVAAQSARSMRERLYPAAPSNEQAVEDAGDDVTHDEEDDAEDAASADDTASTDDAPEDETEAANEESDEQNDEADGSGDQLPVVPEEAASGAPATE